MLRFFSRVVCSPSSWPWLRAGTVQAQGFGCVRTGRLPDGDGVARASRRRAPTVRGCLLQSGWPLVRQRDDHAGRRHDRPKGRLHRLDDIEGEHAREALVPGADDLLCRRRLARRWRSVSACSRPYGLTTEWPTTSQGRFLGYKSLVQAVYVQPTLAYKVNDKLSVGVGHRPHVSERRTPSARGSVGAGRSAPGTFGSVLGVGGAGAPDFADVQMRGHKWHAGFNAGVIYKANDKVSFGARFLSGQKVTVGDAAISTSQISAVKADGSVYTLPITIPGVAPAGTPLNTLVAGHVRGRCES